MKQIIFIIFLYFPIVTLAQVADDSTISLSGTLKDEQNQSVAYATITNLSTHTGVVSDAEGFFYIQFNRQDTLELSAIGYEKYQIYLGDTATANNYDLNIRLSEKTYQLENVTVFAYQDEEAFKKAILALDEDVLPKEAPKVKVPGAYEGPRVDKRPSPVSPVSFIYDRFSKRARYEREARKAEQEYEYQKILSKKFNRDLVGKITGLTDQDLNKFMLFCHFEDKFIERSNEYEIILAINQCYEDFLQ